ncbi:fibrocystin-L-like [Scylla paramamosain]|uniref:fibrocystin-L-like n=1 Tax=Scylla paramamosain TaxID=85552 RepID=UPI00308341DA
MDRLVETVAEDEDNVLSGKYLHGLGQKARLSLVDVLEAPWGFWGSFTGTGAATFEETVQLGAWRMAGIGPLPHILDHNPQERHPQQSHSTEDHPTSYSCTITSLTPTKVSCTAAGLSAGSYRPMVTMAGARAVVGNKVTSTTLPVASALTPQSGSINGGAVLVGNSSGFIPGYMMVVVGGAECSMLQESANTISCRLPPGIEGEAAVVVSVACSENVMAAKAFTYAAAVTPMLLSVTPSTDVVSSTTLTLDGTGFTLSGGTPEVTVGGKRCGLVSPASPTSLQCIVPALGGGKHEVVVRDAVYGDSNNLSISLIFSLTSLTPSSGSFGGARIMLAGQGFDPDGGSLVTLCDLPCDLVSSDSTTAITCVAPALPHSEADVTCDVVVSSPNGLSASLLGGFTYQLALTLSLTGLEPQ